MKRHTAELQPLELRMCHSVPKRSNRHCLRVEDGARHLLLLLLILVLILTLVLRGRRPKHVGILIWLRLGAEYARRRRVEERVVGRRVVVILLRIRVAKKARIVLLSRCLSSAKARVPRCRIAK